MSQEKIKNRIDYTKLAETLSVQSYHDKDKAMLDYIREHLLNLDVIVQEDKFKNIYVTKGKAKSYPCVVAHTDTVQQILTNVEIHRSEDTIFAFDPILRRQCGTGGDDKVGVYITLQLLEDIDVMKAVFFRQEEIGCLGSRYSMRNHKEWYDDCGYVLMADRKGDQDIITVSGGILIASTEFLETCDPIFEKYGYEDETGLFSDIDTLTSEGIGISTVNFSCGYHEPHSLREVVSVSDVNRCYNMMFDILTEHGDKVFKYAAKIPEYKKWKKSNSEKVIRNSIINQMTGYGESINKRQGKLFAPLVFGGKNTPFENFAELDVILPNKKLYKYIGTKALLLTEETRCKKCNTSVVNNVFFLPYEGRMYCAECNDYVNDEDVPGLLKYLEVEDNGTVFIHSLYSNGWLPKEDAKWNEKIKSWVSNQLPF